MHAVRARVVSLVVLAVFADRAGGDPADGSGGDPGHPDDRGRRRAAIGVLGAVTAFCALATLHAVGTPAFAPPDETSHVAYALALTEGVIPHIAAFPEDLPIPGMREGMSVWTANHPPGAYALMAVPLWIGVEVGQPLAGFIAARLLNVAGAAVALVMTARIAGLLLPRRPRVVVGVTVLAALVPYSIHIAGTAYTDGLASAPTVALLAAAVEVLLRGPSRRRLIALVALSAAASLVRAPAVVLVLLAGSSWGVAQLLHADAGSRQRLRRGVGGATLIGLAALAAAGWFFIGNVALYGDPTGSDALFALHSREPRAPFLDILTSSQQYRFQELQLWSKVEGLPPGSDYVVSGYFVQDVHRIILGLLWLAGGLAVWHSWRTRLRGERTRVAAWVLLAAWWWALMAMMASFVSQGGAPHARYLWPAFTGLALLLVLALDRIRLPGRTTAPETPNGVTAALRRLGGLPVGHYTALGALLWANSYAYPRMLELFDVVGPDTDLVRSATAAFDALGVARPGWWALSAVVTLVVGVSSMAWSLWAIPARTDAPDVESSGASAHRGVAAAGVATDGVVEDDRPPVAQPVS